jgi:hypothetical protein
MAVIRSSIIVYRELPTFLTPPPKGIEPNRDTTLTSSLHCTMLAVYHHFLTEFPTCMHRIFSSVLSST